MTSHYHADYPKKINWVPILMNSDFRGAILGRYSLEFKANGIYLVDQALSDVFLKANVCSIYGGSDVPWILHVNENKNTFRWHRQ